MAQSLGLGEASAGKRIRPLLALLTCHCLGTPVEKAMPFAVAMELMHSFALVHDDIEDGDQWRRGQPAIWIRHGLAHGINIGDGLLTRAFLVLSQSDAPEPLRLRWMELLAHTLTATIEGQALDISARTKHNMTVEDYLDLVTRKTGRYLAAPLVGGALAADAPPATLKALAQLGPLLGPLFQILDDLIDLTAGKGREAPGNDLREGKRSFLVVYALNYGSPSQIRQLLAVLDTPRDQTTPEQVTLGMTILEEAGAMDAAHQQAQSLLQKAHEILSHLQPPLLSSTLQKVFDNLAQRTA
jgi:geranylgeranyl pyrophosphate synthase